MAENQGDISEAYFFLVQFIAGYKAETNEGCPQDAMNDIKRLFKSFILQGKSMQEALKEKNSRILQLERDIVALENMMKDQLSMSSISSAKKRKGKKKKQTVIKDDPNNYSSLNAHDKKIRDQNDSQDDDSPTTSEDG